MSCPLPLHFQQNSSLESSSTCSSLLVHCSEDSSIKVTFFRRLVLRTSYSDMSSKHFYRFCFFFSFVEIIKYLAWGNQQRLVPQTHITHPIILGVLYIHFLTVFFPSGFWPTTIFIQLIIVYT
jgi:hypothetical protein